MKKYLYYVLESLLFASCGNAVQGFTNISDIIWYAHAHPEYPLSDEQDFSVDITRPKSLLREIWFETQGHETQPFVTLIDPSYQYFYHEMRPSFFKRILQFFGLKTALWKPQDLEALLQRHNESSYNQQSNVNKQQVVVCKIKQPETPVHCIIIGDLDGAFHSLARILQNLATRGELDENLKLMRKNTHLIFLGNIIGASPYCAELLTIILMLIEQNPDHVWCMCGWNEIKQRWKASPLLPELSIRYQISPRDSDRFSALIQDAFVILPRGLVFVEPGKKQFVQFSSHEIVDKETLAQIAACASNSIKDVEWCTVLEGIRTKIEELNISCCGLIETKHTWDTIWPTEPLTSGRAVPGISGTVWDLLSGQTEVLRRVYRCKWESYCLVDLTVPLELSTMEFIGSMIDNTDGFKCRSRVRLCSGEAVDATCS
jgi:hypothetical protein